MATLYSLDAVSAGHQGLLDIILAGEGDPTIQIFDAADTVLAIATIDTLLSYVAIENADIIIAIDQQEDACPAGGTASYAQLINGDSAPVVQMPCKAGTEAEAGYCVINTLTIIQGAPLDVLSVTIPATTNILEVE